MQYWFEYDSSGNIVNRYLQSTSPTAGTGNSLVSFDQDTASADVVTAYNLPNRYLIKGTPAVPVAQPYITLSVADGAAATTGTAPNSYSVATKVVTATIQNPPTPAPSQVTFSVFGGTFTASVANNQATLTLGIHPAVTDPQTSITASATGCMSATTSWGTQVPTYALKAAVPSGETNPIIHPSGTGARSALSTYWTSTATTSAYSMADIGTVIGLLLDMVYGHMAPQMQTAGTLTLTDNAKNLASFMQNTMLPTIPSTHETAAPKPATGAQQTFDMHFGHYQSVQKATQTAMEKYGADVQRFTDAL